MLAPLFVSRLALRGFRNLAPLEIEPGRRFNVIAGENGAGKSNLLEAIDYAARLESFRGARAESLVSARESTARIEARFEGDVLPHVAKVLLSREDARKLSLDGKRPKSIAEWQATMHSVVFHPGHVELPAAAPEERRATLDRILGQIDLTYASALASYTKALRSRNRLLKDENVDRRGITAYDDLLASSGSVVGSTRQKLVAELVPVLVRSFEEILDEKSRLVVEYVPRVEPTFEKIRSALARSLDKDIARGFTAEGPHADDLVLRFDERAAKHNASKGQHRAMVLSLKVAELAVLSERLGKTPPLLLDDVSSELDRVKNRRFFSMISRLGGQVFLTTTHPEFILIDEERVDLRIDGGEIRNS